MDTAGQPTSLPHSRRGFLKKGIFGGLILAVGGGGFLASRRGRSIPLPPEGLKVLDPGEYAVLMAIAARLIPEGEGFPSVEQVGVGLNADRILAQTDPAAAREVKQLLNLFENALAGRENSSFDGFDRGGPGRGAPRLGIQPSGHPAHRVCRAENARPGQLLRISPELAGRPLFRTASWLSPAGCSGLAGRRGQAPRRERRLPPGVVQ